MENLQDNNFESHEPTLREQIEQYLRYWPWFVLCVLLSLSIAYVYLRYATPIYQTVATILIKDEKNSALSELAVFQDLGLTGNLNQAGFENEMQILKSRSLTERVVRDLNLNVKYLSEGNIRSAELFENLPFRVTVLSEPDSLKFPAAPFYITPISDLKFELWGDGQVQKSEYNFGDPISLPFGDIMVTPNLEALGRDKHQPIKVVVQSIPSTVSFYRQNIQVEQLNKMSSVIQLTSNMANAKKAQAVLNELIKQYNQDAIEDRNMVSRNTAEFINGRLEIITKELDSVEVGKVEFKQENKLTDIAAEGQLFLQSESEFNKRQLEVETQLELVRTMLDYVQNDRETELLPTNLGIEKEGLATAINNYNQLVLERNRILTSSTEKNPVVVSLNEQIDAVKSTVVSGLNNARISLQIARNDLRSQEAVIGGKISSIPSKEKIFRSISRQQEIKETLYLYLLQKREENAISMAVTTPKAKVVDFAYSSNVPVSPKVNIILLAALILGLLIPFGFIYLKNLLDNKIRSRSYIEQQTQEVSIIGEIPKLDKKDEELIGKNDHSILAESFRILRTNLQYLFRKNTGNSQDGKVIFVTSTVTGEGKTFVSINVALTLAHSGAKVALVGGDIRKPKLQRYLPSSYKKEGVVEYLVHEDVKISDYLQQSELSDNLQLFISDTIPPNPAELWMRPRAEQMFEELKERFDYVVVDTAPSMLVTDTLLISDYADVTLYVIKAGHTEKRLLEFPLENSRNKKLKNIAFVLNNVSAANFGYGNKYGYSYVKRKASFWEKAFGSR